MDSIVLMEYINYIYLQNIYILLICNNNTKATNIRSEKLTKIVSKEWMDNTKHNNHMDFF